MARLFRNCIDNYRIIGREQSGQPQRDRVPAMDEADPLADLDAAIAGVQRIVARIRAGQWELPTPCGGWMSAPWSITWFQETSRSSR